MTTDTGSGWEEFDRENNAAVEAEDGGGDIVVLPEDVRAMLADPQRPRATEYRHPMAMADFIMRRSELGRRTAPVWDELTQASDAAVSLFGQYRANRLIGVHGPEGRGEAAALSEVERRVIDRYDAARRGADAVAESEDGRAERAVYKTLVTIFHFEVEQSQSGHGRSMRTRRVNTSRVLDLLDPEGVGEGKTREDLMAATRKSDKWVRDQLAPLVADDLVVKARRGRGGQAPWAYWRRADVAPDAAQEDE